MERTSHKIAPTRPITIKDVAKQLGVSPSTVARAMVDHPRISTEMKALVHKTASKMGYVLNSPARSMRGGSSNLIGLVIPDVQNDFYSSIASTLSRLLEDNNFQLVLSISNDSPDREAAQIASLVSARVAGIIIVPTAMPQKATRNFLARTKHVQLLRRIPDLRSDWFGLADEGGIRSATQHLIAFGHRRIAYIGGQETLTTGKARLKGFRSALNAAKLEIPARFIEIGPPGIASGFDSMSRLLTLKHRPTAVVMGSVGSTLGALAACRANHIRTPADISIVGFGDAPAFEWWGDGLSTLSFPVVDLAIDSASWLIKRIKQGEDAGVGRESVHGCSLVIRASTAKPSRLKS